MKLYTILNQRQAYALLLGRKRLSQFVHPGDRHSEFDGTLTASINVPSKRDAVAIEVNYVSDEGFNQYILQIMDSPTTYELPPSLLDIGVPRKLSDDELMGAARVEIRSCCVPSSTPFWHCVRDTPEDERMDRHGSYLMRAYLELRKNEMPEPGDRDLLFRLKYSAAKLGYAPGALILAGEQMAEFQRIALIPALGPFPTAFDEATIDAKALEAWPSWVAELVPVGSKWDRLRWPDGSMSIRLRDPNGVLAAKCIAPRMESASQ